MAENIVNSFRNSILDIQYNLAQNVIRDEEGLSNLELEVRDMAIELWKGHLLHKIFKFQAINYTTDIFYYNYKFKDWINDGKVQVIQNFAATEVLANIWEPIKLEIPKIGDEIVKFAEILGSLKCYLSKETLVRFLDGLYITPKGTINYIKTAISLIENTDLQHKYKYAIACYFCLEDKISEFHEEILGEYGHRFIYNESGRLMVFWTYHLDNKDEKFNEEIKNRLGDHDSNNEHLLDWAIRNENEVAVYYIWEKLIDNELKKYIADYVRLSLNCDSDNIMCYLISQVNDQSELEELARQEGHAILSKLLFNSRWRKYYKNAANFVFSFTDEMTFLNAIKTAVVFWLENESNKELYQILLNEIIVKFQVDIKVDFVFNKKTFLLILLFVESENIMKELLNVGNDEELKSLFHKNNIIIPVGKHLFINKKLKIFETFIREVLVGDEIEEFLKRFFDNSTI